VGAALPFCAKPLSALPALFAGTWLGLKLFGRLNEVMFRKIVLALLLISPGWC
jgi:uncharacterized protein